MKIQVQISWVGQSTRYKCWRRDVPRFVFSGISTSCAVIWWQGEEIFRKANETVWPSWIWKVSKIDTTDVPGDAMTTIFTTILKTSLTTNLDWLPLQLFLAPYGSLWLSLALSCSLLLIPTVSDWLTDDYQFERLTRQCATGQITYNFLKHKVGGYMRFDNLQLPRVQPPISVCTTSNFLTNLIVINSSWSRWSSSSG